MIKRSQQEWLADIISWGERLQGSCEVAHFG